MVRFTATLFLLLLSLSFSSLVAAEEEYWEYTFRPGDSMWSIAKQYTTTVNNWDELRKLNSAQHGPDLEIRPGTRILIPVSMLKLQPEPAVVIAVKGNVSLLRANGDKTEVTNGTKLYSGDQIQTSDQQSLRMQFADKS